MLWNTVTHAWFGFSADGHLNDLVWLPPCPESCIQFLWKGNENMFDHWRCAILNVLTKVGIEKVVYTILCVLSCLSLKILWKFKVIQSSFYIALELVLKTENYRLTGQIKKKYLPVWKCFEVDLSPFVLHFLQSELQSVFTGSGKAYCFQFHHKLVQFKSKHFT